MIGEVPRAVHCEQFDQNIWNHTGNETIRSFLETIWNIKRDEIRIKTTRLVYHKITRPMFSNLQIAMRSIKENGRKRQIESKIDHPGGKVQLFWEGRKIFDHLPLFNWHYLVVLNLVQKYDRVLLTKKWQSREINLWSIICHGFKQKYICAFQNNSNFVSRNGP